MTWVAGKWHEELDESDDDIYDAKGRAEAILFSIATDWATEIRSKDDNRR